MPLTFTDKKDDKEKDEKKEENQNKEVIGAVYESKSDIRYLKLMP
jgi:hypothetical protein